MEIGEGPRPPPPPAKPSSRARNACAHALYNRVRPSAVRPPSGRGFSFLFLRLRRGDRACGAFQKAASLRSSSVWRASGAGEGQRDR